MGPVSKDFWWKTNPFLSKEYFPLRTMSEKQVVVEMEKHVPLQGLSSFIKGVLHPLSKLACFLLYLQIINTFLKNDICIF